jgi:hypothetical protein
VARRQAVLAHLLAVSVDSRSIELRHKAKKSRASPYSRPTGPDITRLTRLPDVRSVKFSSAPAGAPWSVQQVRNQNQNQIYSLEQYTVMPTATYSFVPPGCRRGRLAAAFPRPRVSEEEWAMIFVRNK